MTYLLHFFFKSPKYWLCDRTIPTRNGHLIFRYFYNIISCHNLLDFLKKPLQMSQDEIQDLTQKLRKKTQSFVKCFRDKKICIEFWYQGLDTQTITNVSLKAHIRKDLGFETLILVAPLQNNKKTSSMASMMPL